MKDWAKIAVLGALGGVVYKVWEWMKRLAWRTLTVRITVDDPSAYEWIAEWLAEEMNDRDSTVLSVIEGEMEDESRPLDSRARFIPGEGLHVFWRNGRRIAIEHSKEGYETPGSFRGESRHFTQKSFTLRTFGRDSSPLRRLVIEAEAAYREARHNSLPVWTARWGSWNETAYTHGRSIESVVLADGVAERLLGDVRRFLASEERYANVGIPWRRGYLLHGSPGCGKSSLVRAIATECGLPLYVVSMVKVDDESLVNLLHDVSPRSVVLMEDVEEHVDDPENGVTRSGLLNALDGAVATEGRILFMTTNYYDRLDPALIRPGRADVQVELRPATTGQAARMYKRFFPGSPECDVYDFAVGHEGKTPAEIQGHLIEMWEGSPQ